MPHSKPSATPRRILNCLPSRATEADWTFGAAVLAGVTNPTLSDKRDRRERWWTVGDQGATGSCVGWAAADAVLRWHFVKAGWIRPTDHLSVRFTWMAAKETDEFTGAATTFIEPEGTSLKAALDVARKYGSVLDADLPFAGGGLFPDAAQVFYAKAARLKIASYINLEPSLTSWRRWIDNNGPILVRLNVDKTWDEVQANGQLDVYHPETARGGHAVALVGYEKDHFIVRNSWGKDWADKGFAYASDAYAATAFTEAYGVTLGASLVEPGIAEKAERSAAAAVDTGGIDQGWSIEQIEAAVIQAARRAARRDDLFLAQTVGEVFNTLQALNALLGHIQQALDLRMELASAPTTEKLKLGKGSFYALADWVMRRIKTSGGGE